MQTRAYTHTLKPIAAQEQADTIVSQQFAERQHRAGATRKVVETHIPHRLCAAAGRLDT